MRQHPRDGEVPAGGLGQRASFLGAVPRDAEAGVEARIDERRRFPAGKALVPLERRLDALILRTDQLGELVKPLFAPVRPGALLVP